MNINEAVTKDSGDKSFRDFARAPVQAFRGGSEGDAHRLQSRFVDGPHG
jgi:hypothetical protein